jgi:hypothetical protein
MRGMGRRGGGWLGNRDRLRCQDYRVLDGRIKEGQTGGSGVYEKDGISFAYSGRLCASRMGY